MKNIEELLAPTSGWYSGSGGLYGPRFDTREEALAAAMDEGDEYVACATKTPLRVSDHFDVDTFLDAAEDELAGIGFLDDDDLTFDFTDEQIEDLESSICDAIDDWQVRHQLAPEPVLFDECREESVE